MKSVLIATSAAVLLAGHAVPAAAETVTSRRTPSSPWKADPGTATVAAVVPVAIGAGLAAASLGADSLDSLVGMAALCWWPRA